MKEYLPYIVSIICSVVAGVASYAVARKNTKSDIEKIIKQHEVDVEELEKKHQLEIERLKVEHENQMELQKEQINAQIGTTLLTEALKIPEVQKQISSGLKNKRR